MAAAAEAPLGPNPQPACRREGAGGGEAAAGGFGLGPAPSSAGRGPAPGRSLCLSVSPTLSRCVCLSFSVSFCPCACLPLPISNSPCLHLASSGCQGGRLGPPGGIRSPLHFSRPVQVDRTVPASVPSLRSLFLPGWEAPLMGRGTLSKSPRGEPQCPICRVSVGTWDWMRSLDTGARWDHRLEVLVPWAHSWPGEETGTTLEANEAVLRVRSKTQRGSQGGGVEAGSDLGWLMASAKVLRPRAVLSQVAGSPSPGHTVS